MKSPVVYGSPVTFGPVDWNYAAGPPVRRGKSVEELGDAGWARERERVTHLQQFQQLHQLQLQQPQVGFPGYGVVSPGQPQGPVMVASPGGPVPVPGCPIPVHGGMMVPAGGPPPPQVHVPAPWSVQWQNQAQIRQDNVCRQPSLEYDDQHKATFTEKRPKGQDVYFHPGSQDGHLDVRISEWKGKHCFYQGPEDYNHQDYSRGSQEKDNTDFRTQEEYGKLDEGRRRRDDRFRETDYNADRYDHRSHKDLDDYEHKDKYRHRDHYERKYNERYENREHKYYDSWKHRKPDPREHDSYSSEYEDNYNHKDTYARRDNYRDIDHYYDRDRDYYNSQESYRYREKEYYKHREEDQYYDERKRKEHYYDRHTEDRYDHREKHNSKDRDVYNRRGEETYNTKERGHYDSEPEEHRGYRERDHYNRYKDKSDYRRDEDYDHRRRDRYKTTDYERRTEDNFDYEKQDYHRSREEDHSHYKARDRYRDLRSISIDSSYEEYPKKDRKTHCEEWVEQQNQKLALREMHSFEDPVIYQDSDDQEKGYESSAGSVGSKRGRKPVYVGSLDRNSFYRKTAPSSLRNSKFATTRKQNKGKHMILSCERRYFIYCLHSIEYLKFAFLNYALLQIYSIRFRTVYTSPVIR